MGTSPRCLDAAYLLHRRPIIIYDTAPLGSYNSASIYFRDVNCTRQRMEIVTATMSPANLIVRAIVATCVRPATFTTLRDYVKRVPTC